MACFTEKSLWFVACDINKCKRGGGLQENYQHFIPVTGLFSSSDLNQSNIQSIKQLTVNLILNELIYSTVQISLYHRLPLPPCLQAPYSNDDEGNYFKKKEKERDQWPHLQLAALAPGITCHKITCEREREKTYLQAKKNQVMSQINIVFVPITNTQYFGSSLVFSIGEVRFVREEMLQR